MQWQNDQALPKEQRQWLHFNEDPKDPLIVLATRTMLTEAVKRGHGEPSFVDATHGLQRYGLKLVTLLVKTDQGEGMPHSAM